MKKYMLIKPENLSFEEIISAARINLVNKVCEKEYSARAVRIAKWVSDATIEELTQIDSVGFKKAQLIKSLVELGRQSVLSEKEQPEKICSPVDLVDFLSPMIAGLKQECFIVVMLNTRSMVIGLKKVSLGTVDSAVVHPREVFRPAIKASAKAVILAHNHPSGDPSPSREDLKITEKLVKTGEIIGIQVVDHLILGDGYLSFKEKGKI